MARPTRWPMPDRRVSNTFCRCRPGALTGAPAPQWLRPSPGRPGVADPRSTLSPPSRPFPRFLSASTCNSGPPGIYAQSRDVRNPRPHPRGLFLTLNFGLDGKLRCLPPPSPLAESTPFPATWERPAQSTGLNTPPLEKRRRKQISRNKICQ